MGDGNVNKGAQRMYDMMKKLRKRRTSIMAEVSTTANNTTHLLL
jgi:hypothetical protein